MSQPVVLIIFSCQTGDTEKLALSAAVGAIQGRALIRLRRLPDPEHSDATETLTRMRKEYVPPAEKDILGANVVILASSPGSLRSETPWNAFLPVLRQLQRDGQLENKVRAAVGSIAASVADLGFVAFEDAMMDCVALGRNLAETANAPKAQ